MSYVKLTIQGESHLGIVNTDQITYITQGIYGASIHFTSGEYLVCDGDLDEVAQKLFGAAQVTPDADSYVIGAPRTA